MNEGKKALKELEKLRKLIYDSRPSIRADYVVGFYRLWTRVPAIERVLIKKGFIKQEEVDKEQIKIMKKMQEGFQIEFSQKYSGLSE